MSLDLDWTSFGDLDPRQIQACSGFKAPDRRWLTALNCLSSWPERPTKVAKDPLRKRSLHKRHARVPAIRMQRNDVCQRPFHAKQPCHHTPVGWKACSDEDVSLTSGSLGGGACTALAVLCTAPSHVMSLRMVLSRTSGNFIRRSCNSTLCKQLTLCVQTSSVLLK